MAETSTELPIFSRYQRGNDTQPRVTIYDGSVEVEVNGLVIRKPAEAWHALAVGSARVVEYPARYDEPQFLVAYGGDGADSRVVSKSELADAYCAIVAGDDAELRAEAVKRLEDPDNWRLADMDENDRRYVFDETFEDGWLTITRILEQPYTRRAGVPSNGACPSCKGKGHVLLLDSTDASLPHSTAHQCKACNGSGTVYDTTRGPDDGGPQTCPKCLGEGDDVEPVGRSPEAEAIKAVSGAAVMAMIRQQQQAAPATGETPRTDALLKQLQDQPLKDKIGQDWTRPFQKLCRELERELNAAGGPPKMEYRGAREAIAILDSLQLHPAAYALEQELIRRECASPPKVGDPQ